MGQVKQNTTWIPVQRAFRVGNAHPSWEMHPEWIQGLKNLDAYNQWVCEIVMPIVFQWVEEHKEEVYKDIQKEHWDDVGVVIEKAFQLVQKMDSHKRGLAQVATYEKAVSEQTLPISTINPVWQEMSAAMDQARGNARDKFKSIFSASIRPDAADRD